MRVLALLIALQLLPLPTEKPKKLPPALTIKVSPQVGIAPLTVRVLVHVRNDERNRRLRVEMTGPLDGESFERDINEHSKATTERLFEVRGGGPIAFTAYVQRSDGTRPFAQAIYCYVGRSELAVCEAEEP